MENVRYKILKTFIQSKSCIWISALTQSKFRAIQEIIERNQMHSQSQQHVDNVNSTPNNTNKVKEVNNN